MASSVSRVLLGPAHEALVERILLHLDLESVLSAAKLPLRAAYYGFPSSYIDFDHPLFGVAPSPFEMIERCIGVQRGWQNLKPKAIKLITQPTMTIQQLVPTCGLVIMAGTTLQQQCSGRGNDLYGWVVRDLYSLRDGNAAKGAPSFSATCDTAFQCLAASREDNMVATASITRNGSTVDVTIRFYILEPTDKHQWNDGDDIVAVPHPAAATISFNENVRDPPDQMLAELPDFATPTFQLGPDGSLMLSIGYPQSTRMWNWRTGTQTMSFLGVTKPFLAHPVSRWGQTSYSVWGLPREQQAWLVTASAYFNLPSRQKCRLAQSLGSATCLAATPHTGMPLWQGGFTRPVWPTVVGLLDELQQASRQWVDQGVQSLSMPLETFSDNVDVNIWSEFAHTAISGYRAVTVHLQSGLHEGQFDFSLHLTDWRVRAERYKDSIHTGPFGGRPACTVPLPPLPVPDDPFVRRPSFAVPLSPPPLLDAVPRQHNEAEWIALGSPWDRTVPAANVLHTLIPNYVIRHRGQKRTVANIFLGVDLHEGDIE
ncbi:uncharacterized protein EHS24_003755 [Apiotrichum porosum]|uniref:Uncharacterized protein n=1 Tax=Apiotrichum porosum TaxID=105984 RepID=A0A427XE46_9TREE|nr:uncharacterized protein EHS24_003755 [Apiotrichum porosum]RSH77125.1 hypothetical protein EHS24_003755 [Apiotrichum porosum]